MNYTRICSTPFPQFTHSTSLRLGYIAGPYRGDGYEYTKAANAARAFRAAHALMAKFPGRWFGVCPHTMCDRMASEQVSDETILQGLEVLVQRMDRLFVLPGWMKSEGTKREIAMAELWSVPVTLPHRTMGLWEWMWQHEGHTEQLWIPA